MHVTYNGHKWHVEIFSNSDHCFWRRVLTFNKHLNYTRNMFALLNNLTRSIQQSTKLRTTLNIFFNISPTFNGLIVHFDFFFENLIFSASDTYPSVSIRCYINVIEYILYYSICIFFCEKNICVHVNRF